MFRFLLAILFIMLTVCGPSPVSSAAEQEESAPDKTAQHILLPHTHKESCALTEPEPVQIICILDRSGSMQRLTNDVIGGYNSFLAQQRQEPGTAEVTTVLFDNRYEIIAKAVDLKEAPELTAKIYYARGTTALLDAIGRTIMETVSRMEEKEICPLKRRVLFMIMTDGMENASREYDKAAVKALIEATTNDYHWNYIFMGANIDSFAEASALGIHSDHAMNYAHDSEGVQESFARMNEAAKEVRESGAVDGNWKGKP